MVIIDAVVFGMKVYMIVVYCIELGLSVKESDVCMTVNWMEGNVRIITIIEISNEKLLYHVMIGNVFSNK